MVKTITFFNEKGGSGKSTLTAMFASFLAYKKKCRVFVYDMDFPGYHLFEFRSNDMKVYSVNQDSTFAREAKQNMKEWYPVTRAAAKAAFSTGDLESIAETLRREKEKASRLPGDTYFLIDFPGRYLPNDPVYYLSKKGLLDMIIFPMDSDSQSRTAALMTYNTMQQEYEGKGKQEVLLLWNRETAGERMAKKDPYTEYETVFKLLGLPIAGVRIRDIPIARRDANSYGFIRNTLNWPENNIARNCAYIESLFEEIKHRIDGTWDEHIKAMIYGR